MPSLTSIVDTSPAERSGRSRTDPCMTSESDSHRDRDRHLMGQRVRVLVVDDHPDIVETFSKLLQICGFEVRTASDGPVALALAAGFQPRVALLDIGLPIMNGYEVARRLRAGTGSEPISLIAVTGYGDEDARRRSRAAGFDSHLVKPVRLDVLLATLSRLVDQAR
jgi:CheY-like chemotaxis protein